MLLKFEKISGINIGPFDNFELPILPGRHLVIGKNNSSNSSNSNGSGKSFITEPLSYAPYKKTFRGKDISKNNNGNMKVELNFSTEKNSYLISRYYNDKNNHNNVELFCDLENVSGRITSVTDQKILDTFGITSDLFFSTILISQGLPINFSQMTPTIRKMIFEEILGFTIWDNLKNKFSNFSTELVNKLQETNKKFQDKKDRMIQLNSSLETLKSTKELASKDYDDKVLKIKNEIKELKLEQENIFKSIKLNFPDNTIDNFDDQLNTLKSSLSIIKSKISDLKTIIEDKKCPTCNQDFPEVMIANAEKEHNLLSKKINNISTLLNSTILRRKNLKEMINKEIEINNNIKIKLSNLNSLADTNKNLDSTEKIKSINENLEILHEEVNSYLDIITEFDTDIKNCKFIENLLKPSSEFRSNLLKSYLSHVNNIISEIIPLVYENFSINLNINSRKTGIDINLKNKENTIEYSSLSGGEKRRVDIVIILAIQRFLFESSGIDTNLIIFDEIFDGLDKTGIDLVLSCIETIFPEFMSIIIISHNNYFKESFNSVISIEKDIDGNSVLNLDDYRGTHIV